MCSFVSIDSDAKIFYSPEFRSQFNSVPRLPLLSFKSGICSIIVYILRGDYSKLSNYCKGSSGFSKFK